MYISLEMNKSQSKLLSLMPGMKKELSFLFLLSKNFLQIAFRVPHQYRSITVVFLTLFGTMKGTVP